MIFYNKYIVLFLALFFLGKDCFAPHRSPRELKGQRHKHSLGSIKKKSVEVFKCRVTDCGYSTSSPGFFRAHNMAFHDGPDSKYIKKVLEKDPDLKRYCKSNMTETETELVVID